VSAAIANPHEELGRSRKVVRLVEEIDRRLTKSGVDVYRAAAKIAEDLERWPDEHWLVLAGKAKVNPPSATTREQVIARYRARAVEYLAEAWS
jgi:hypothetical protein